jgi:tRNA A-37 threonylcarbamoyl transferase component Bud32
MDQTRICNQCQQPFPENALEGLCPACLAHAAVGAESTPPIASVNINPLAEVAPAPRTPPDITLLAAQFPQLEIIELLGMGGMGVVYKARQPRLDRLVALKILPVESQQHPHFAERFGREAKALAKLNHPGIVNIYDFGQTTQYYYFVMEYVDGMNLRQLLKSATVNPRQALELVIQICTALQYAHDEGVVHRDIKPENILLNKKGQVKIADFGLAKLLGSTPDTALTMSQAAMGTLNYMAPEQRQNAQAVDHRADIYSLGVVFYEMLTGEVPMGRFEAPSKRVLVDVRLDEVVLKALEREPARRYQQASEVKSNVETITATPPAVPPVGPAVQAPAQAASGWFPAAIKVLLAISLIPLALAIAAWWQHGGQYMLRWTLSMGIPLLVVLECSGILLIFVLYFFSWVRSKKEFFPQDWTATYDGHSIRVHNSWNRGAKLFVDDVCQASTNRVFAFSKSKPILRCEMPSGNSSYVIEIYAYAVLEVYFKIVVNGKWIGGDNF